MGFATQYRAIDTHILLHLPGEANQILGVKALPEDNSSILFASLSRTSVAETEQCVTHRSTDSKLSSFEEGKNGILYCGGKDSRGSVDPKESGWNGFERRI